MNFACDSQPKAGGRGAVILPAATPHAPLHRGRPANGGFTLLEVMIAAGILFMCLFAILAVLASSLRNARSLRHLPVDAGILASELSLTNKLYEGETSGKFDEPFADYEWSQNIQEVSSNKLFQADFIVRRRSDHAVESQMSILLFRPESPAGSLEGGTGR